MTVCNFQKELAEMAESLVLISVMTILPYAVANQA